MGKTPNLKFYLAPPPPECIYSETYELRTPKGLRKSVLYSEVVLFLRSISTYCIRLRTEAAVFNSQGVRISQVVLKTGFTVPNH